MYVCCQHFQISSPQKSLGRLKPNFMWTVDPPWDGGTKFCSNGPGPCPYVVKTLKNLLLRNQKTMQHWGLKYYQVCSNGDPGLSMTYFMAKSNLVPYAFIWEKGKTVDFSETIVVYDIKVSRCS